MPHSMVTPRPAVVVYELIVACKPRPRNEGKHLRPQQIKATGKALFFHYHIPIEIKADQHTHKLYIQWQLGHPRKIVLQ